MKPESMVVPFWSPQEVESAINGALAHLAAGSGCGARLTDASSATILLQSSGQLLFAFCALKGA